MTDRQKEQVPTGTEGELIAPILGAGFESPETVEFPSDLRVVPVDELPPGMFGAWDGLGDNDALVLASATHAVRLSGILEVNPEENDVGPSAETLQRLNDFVHALSLEVPGPVTFAELAYGTGVTGATTLLRDFTSKVDAVGRFIDHPPHSVSPATLQRALENADKFARIPNLRVAADRLAGVWERTRYPGDAVVDLCIGIEALLGSGRDEIVHRISMRAAAMLSSRGWGPSGDVYKAFKDIYAYRSQVVHGTPGPYKQELLKIGDDPPVHAVRYATAALTKLLKIYLAAGDDLAPGNLDQRYIFDVLDWLARGESR